MTVLEMIKKSLGFELDEDPRYQSRNNSPNRGYSSPRSPRQNPNYGSARPRPDFDDVEPIIPEQSFYEIVLMRPRTIDDVNYVVDQVIEEKNPVILDLSFLENESPANFKLAGDKIRQMRNHYGAQALLLSRTSEKNLIVLSPKKVKLVKKV